MKNYYEILQVDKNATFEVINRIYKYHIKKNHPDLFEGKEKEEAKKRVQEFNEAYEVLSKEEKRKEYDENLKNSHKDIKEDKISLQYLKRLEEENNILHEQLIYKDTLLKNILNELNIPYADNFGHMYEEQTFKSNDNEKKDNQNSFFNYLEYVKISFFKVIIIVIFILLILIVLSNVTQNNYLEFLKSLLNF